ncbi:putative neutrophil cytosol factor 1C [Sinocyclocheilus grahami]|uniref:putative neutrophil cytosol factor 1C n=1 Tax=Sinocyclocheilus grahami TaxID=75366 RepID=UPI0007AC6545|nr:PREDICTED: NADPH oxidase organizer 1 [Sinocyclocheilus grahami]
MRVRTERNTLEEYCSELLKSDPRFCQSSELIQFLLPKPQDLDSDLAKNSIVIMPSETSLSSGNVGMNNVTQPFVTETYRCIATYETKDTKNRPFKVEVDEIVDVLIKDQKGWWLVENEAKHLAWFPAPYLQRAEMDDDGPDVMDDGSVFYVAAKSYKAMNSDELSVEIGSVVEVLQKSDNGWWIVRYNRKAGFVPSMYLQPYNNPRMHLMPAKREITSSTLDLAQLQRPGENFLQVSSRELSRSQGNLGPPGSTLDPKDKQMSRSMSRLPDAHTTRLTPPSVRVEFVENGQQSSLSDDSEEFSDDSSFSGKSLNRSDTEEQLRRSRTPTLNSSGSLSPESAEGGKMIGSRSDPSLNKMPSTPKIPPRPKAQEILKRCTTVTCKNLQRTS